MKRHRLLSLLTAFLSFTCTALAQGSAFNTWTIANTKGQDSIDANGIFRTHAIPAGYAHIEGSPRFNVSVNKSYVGLFNDRNFWGGNVAFAPFEFENGNEIEIVIASRATIETFDILPHDARLLSVEQPTGQSISIRLAEADQKLTLVINDEYQKDVLHLFCNSIDHDAPTVELPEGKNYVYDRAQGLHYFGPGYHNLSDLFAYGTLSISTDKKIYVAAGAVLEGQLQINRGNGAKIYGRGLLMNVEPNIVTQISNSTNCSIEGITIHGHRASCWCNTISSSDNIRYSNVNIITTRYASTDGIDITHCSDCTFDNVFVRSCDDAIAIKGLAGETQAPADCPANSNLSFHKMQLWNDCNNAFGMGAETRASAYENISLTDSEILFSYDDPNNHEQLDERSAMNICALHGTYFRNILFENIYVNRCERLIGLGFKSDFWFGSIQGDQSFPGGISGVTFRNITSPDNSGSSIANQIHMYGWHEEGTPDKFVENITFDNVTIEGKLLTDEGDPHILTNNTDGLKLVRNLIFTDTGSGMTSIQGKPQIYPTVVHQGDIIHLSTPSDADNVHWSIYDLTGQLITTGTGTEVLTEGLSSVGFYILSASSIHGQFACKIRLK